MLLFYVHIRLYKYDSHFDPLNDKKHYTSVFSQIVKRCGHSVYYMIELKLIKQLYHLHLRSNLNQIVEI